MRNLFWGEPRWRPGTRWRWYWGVAATLVIFVASQSVAGILAYTFWSVADTAPGSGPLNSFTMRILLASQAAIVGLTLLAARLAGGRPADELRLHAPANGWRSYAGAILAMIPVLIAINALAWAIRPEDTLRDFRMFAALAKSAEPLVPALAIGLGAPASEELLFRGFLLTALGSTRLGFWPASVIVTFAWTLLHWGYSAVGLAEVFAIGMFLSWLLWRTGSLLVPLFCHVVYNASLFVALRYFVV
jgi:uncharacterized protein